MEELVLSAPKVDHLDQPGRPPLKRLAPEAGRQKRAGKGNIFRLCATFFSWPLWQSIANRRLSGFSFGLGVFKE
ncbi:hypothetical protein Y032_0153g2931 [Ancylostoma ceylanicum]|nr:hypothetical protein Y032_0153g2931 [Ancylostoma ceylanicum]